MSITSDESIEILRDYYNSKLSDVETSLSSCITSKGGIDPKLSPNNPKAIQVNDARHRLLDFLKDPSLPGIRNQLLSPDRQNGVYASIARREFDIALGQINGLMADTGLPTLEPQIFSTAFTTQPLPFTFLLVIEVPGGRPPKRFVKKETALKGYSGPVLNNQEIDELLDLHELLAGGDERKFRLGLLRAECLLGLRQFKDAIVEYSRLLPPAQLVLMPIGFPEGTLPPLFERFQRDPVNLSAEQKFVALRAALAYLALGDSLYRSTRELNPDQRFALMAVYDAALMIIEGSGIRPENPVRQQIVETVTFQKEKIAARSNFLGFRDSFVPVIRPERLRELAKQRVDAAKQAVHSFEDFLSKANQLGDVLTELDMGIRTSAVSLQISQKRIQNADDQIQVAEERLEALSDQVEYLDTGFEVDLFSHAVLTGAAALSGGGIGGGGLPGFLSTGVDFLARRNEIKHQQQIGRIEENIARRERNIATLEHRINSIQKTFLENKRQIVANRLLNPDLYYSLANTMEALAESHLEAAVLWAYLYERAIAYKRLKPPDFQLIDFQIFDPQTGIFDIPSRLESQLIAVDDADVPDEKGQLLIERISLRYQYPIEFSRFLGTGNMDFVISLYDFEKRRPGTYKQRIQKLNVEVIGLIPPTGFTGRIIHHGTFLLRDKESTLNPSTKRLIPTDEQLSAVFADLQAGGLPGDPIAGVIPYVLDQDRLELSADTLVSSSDTGQEFSVNLFEGFGPAGLWTLEIENINQRYITDVILRITLQIPESSDQLQTRVRELIQVYEEELAKGDRLDRITGFSLRDQFPDAFFGLVYGPATFTLRAENFPAGITDMKVKTVIGQALDPDGRGVPGIAIEIARLDVPFNLSRTTGPEGFTEDFTKEPIFLPRQERFRVEGNWQISLSDPAQASTLQDLRLFFIYEFREI